ncbi:hypothetical protein L873DRAFT_399773 [Choiromyces venosus 120613-1]|uniref:Uncharacterized protein n=1 Tax=Choiromyces venosus 120613-1 TaxID=1336337 RepID=A0A3N4IXS4_9PEZI|nr:hypothetical protein L873DRAFT_399773 [Choiromyces venosus 120613-1]
MEQGADHNRYYWGPPNVASSTYSGPSQNPNGLIAQVEPGLEAVPEGFSHFGTLQTPQHRPPRPRGLDTGGSPPSPLMPPVHQQPQQRGNLDRQPGLEATAMPSNMHLHPQWRGQTKGPGNVEPGTSHAAHTGF